jgi:hypothetical protein
VHRFIPASVAASAAHADFSAVGVGQDPAAAGGAITRRGGSGSRRGVDHLKAAAEARLHKLDPEAYLRHLFRVLAHWRRDRYLELAPKYWAETRSRLDAGELAHEVGPLSVPAPVPATEEQSAPNVAG